MYIHVPLHVFPINYNPKRQQTFVEYGHFSNCLET